MRKFFLKTISLISILIICVGITSAALTVTSITPNTGEDTGDVQITDLHGTELPKTEEADVNLTRSGELNITGVVGFSNGAQIRCSFPIKYAQWGLWNVVVTNKSTLESVNKTDFFTITHPAPIASSITPATGMNTGTTIITDLVGSNFLSGAKVNLTRSGYPNIEATGLVVTSDKKITCNFVLSGAASGTWNVVVTNPDGKSVTISNGFTISSGPSVTSINPSAGVNTGTVSITNLAGNGFYGTPVVNLTRSGYTNITATVDDTSSTQIICTIPLTGAQWGNWNVEVKNPDGQIGVLSNGFMITGPNPTISGITPSSGENTGSVAITDLTGTGFLSGAKVNLTRGSSKISATNVQYTSATKLNCTLPLIGNQLGKWTVEVTNPDGMSGTLSDGFTITGPNPTISSITPSTGQSTGLVTINNLAGTGFQDGAIVNLTRTGYANITNTTLHVVSDSQIVCILPITGAASGVWNVTVENPDKKSGIKANSFTITGLSHTVTSITPSSGQNTASVRITNLAGTGFKSGAIVYLSRTGCANIKATNVVVPFSTQIACTFPITGKKAGTWNVVVKNPDGQKATLSNGFTITSLTPSITSITPNTGTPYKNTTVTINGASFRPGAVVNFIRGTTLRKATVSSITDGKIVCSLPTKSAPLGLWRVQIKNTDGKFVNNWSFKVLKTIPAISSVTPYAVSSTKNTAVTISGKNFRSGAVVKISRGAIVKKATVSKITDTRINCILPTKNAADGWWNVIVTNTDKTTVTKKNELLITTLLNAKKLNKEVNSGGSVSEIVLKTPVSVPTSSVPSKSSALSAGVVTPINKPSISPKVPEL